LYAGAALEEVLLPNIVLAAALDKEKLRAGVVVAVATLVENNGLKLPDEKLVTEPPLLDDDNVPADNVKPLPTVTLENPPVPLLAKSCADVPVVAGA